MRDSIIYTNPDEEITSIVDKLIKTQASEVFLVVPKNSAIAQSSVNLRLLKREADNLRKRIMIVTQDEALTRLAKKVDFSVDASLPEFASPESDKENEESFSNRKIAKKDRAAIIKKGEGKEQQSDQEESWEEETDYDIKSEMAKRDREKDEEILNDEIPHKKFEEFLREEKRPGALSMVDIVKSGTQPKGKALSKSSKKEETDSENEIMLPVKKISSRQEAELKTEADLDEEEKSLPVRSYVKKEMPRIMYEKDYPAPRFGSAQPRSDSEQDDLEKKSNFGFFRDREEQGVIRRSKERIEKGGFARGNLVPSFSIKIFGIFVAAAVIVAGLVFYLVLPKAEIRLTAKKDTISSELTILADTSATQVDSGLAKIPSQLVKVDDRLSAEFQTTGEKQLSEKAGGTVTLFNGYSSSPQTLVETTRLLSKGGKIFRLVKTVTVPGAQIEEGKIVPSSIDVEVLADQPGPDYNVGPGDFTIPGFQGSPKYTAFYGRSNKAMSGGATGTVKIITQEDFDKAKASLWANVQEKIKQELKDQTPKELKVIDGVAQTQMVEAKSSVEVGKQADKFTLTIRGIIETIAFSEEDISKLLEKKLADQIDGKSDLAGQVTVSYSDAKPNFDKGQMKFNAKCQQPVIGKIDIEEIKRTVGGKDEKEIRQIFSQRQEIEKAQVSLWPFWTKKIPTQFNRIDVTVD